jgi:hypothetical protein
VRLVAELLDTEVDDLRTTPCCVFGMVLPPEVAPGIPPKRAAAASSFSVSSGGSSSTYESRGWYELRCGTGSGTDEEW